MKVLLTGKTGQVGRELLELLQPEFELVAVGSGEMNLADEAGVRRVLRDVRPDILINPAAYTAVDLAESEPDKAFAVNKTAPRILAEEMHALGGAMIHFSTDFVFDGTKAAPYVEGDPTSPLNVYGASKRDGELEIAKVGLPHLIFRTSWVYSRHGKNFPRTIARLLRERETLNVVADQYGAPTWSRSLAEAVLQVLQHAGADPVGFVAESSGLYHLTAGGRTSWADFAQTIADMLGKRGERVGAVHPVDSGQYVTAARRPGNSTLDNAKAGRRLDLSLEHWQEGFLRCFSDASI